MSEENKTEEVSTEESMEGHDHHCHHHGHRRYGIKMGLVAAVIVLAAALAFVAIDGHGGRDSMREHGRFGRRGEFGKGMGGDQLGDGPGRFMSPDQGRIDSGIKSRFFDSSGALNKNAVTDFLGQFNSSDKTQIVSRIKFEVDQAVNSGELTKTQGDQLRNALDGK